MDGFAGLAAFAAGAGVTGRTDGSISIQDAAIAIRIRDLHKLIPVTNCEPYNACNSADCNNQLSPSIIKQKAYQLSG